MNSRKTRLLLWSGCLGAIVLFAGDMLFYGDWGSARSWSHDYFLNQMASVATWRLHLGSITGPVGTGCEILGYVGIWLCCQRTAPLGMPLWGGWWNLTAASWFAVLALTYKDEQKGGSK